MIQGEFDEIGQLFFEIELIAGSEFREIILGLPWLRTRRLLVDFPAGVLALG